METCSPVDGIDTVMNDNFSGSETGIQALLDKQAIRECLQRYVRGMDRQDFGMALSVWNPGGKAMYEDAVYEGSESGDPEAFMRFAAKARQDFECFTHQLTNILIRVDGNTADSEAYLLQVLIIGRSEPNSEFVLRLHTGRYLDRWSKTLGGWGIDERLYLQDMTVELPVSAARTVLSSATSHNDHRDASCHFIDLQ